MNYDRICNYLSLEATKSTGELNNVTDSVVAQAVGRLRNAAVCGLMLFHVSAV